MRALPIVCAMLLLASPAGSQERVRTVAARDGTPIRYEVRGMDRSGPAMLLVHGVTNNRTFWEPHTTNLSASHPVIVVDLAGHGESGSDRKAWSMEAYGSDIRAVVDDLHLESVVLVGFSLGAGVVVEAALQMPKRTLGVVLVDWLQDPTQQYNLDRIHDAALSTQEFWGQPDAIRRSAFSADTPDSLIARYIANTPAEPPAIWWDIYEMAFRWRNEQGARAVERLSCPVALIASDRFKANVEVFERDVPWFEYHGMAGLGHIGVIWERTDEFDAFLESVAQRMVGTRPDG